MSNNTDEPDNVRYQRRINRGNNMFVGSITTVILAMSVFMGAMAVDGSNDSKEITPEEQAEATQSCMISVASSQIWRQMARDGKTTATVVVDTGNNEVESCVISRATSADTNRQVGGTIMGTLFGIAALGFGGAWFRTARAGRRQLKEELKRAHPSFTGP